MEGPKSRFSAVSSCGGLVVVDGCMWSGFGSERSMFEAVGDLNRYSSSEVVGDVGMTIFEGLRR